MKNIAIWIILSLTIIILSGILVFSTSWDKDVKNQILNYTLILITCIGFFIAIYQLRIASKQYLENNQIKTDSFLDLKINVSQNHPYYSVKTKVLNSVGVNKKIKFALLTISKQNDDILCVVNNVCANQKIPLNFDKTNDFDKLQDFLTDPIYLNNSMGIIPLNFYYSENCQIGNESPAYTYTFNNQPYQLNPDIYSVRFFVYREQEEGFHRVTADSLIIDGNH